MPRTKGHGGDFHNGVDRKHERGISEDVRLSDEGRGPGYSAKRVIHPADPKSYEGQQDASAEVRPDYRSETQEK